ncbi:MAG: hypothetical protein ABI603_10990, partial [Acidobacteriota bacterium]
MGARAEIELLLKASRLDVTLTSAAPWRQPGREVAPVGLAALDAALAGGLPRGQLSEIVGPRSAGRSTVLAAALAAAADRGEAAALIDTSDRFDPASAEAAGLDLSALLWIRDTGDATRALKAMHLVLQAGGFGLVAFDLTDVPAPLVRRFPHTTWMRIARLLEGSQTAAVLLGGERIARSPGGVSMALEAPRPCWTGAADRARLLHAVTLRPR